LISTKEKSTKEKPQLSSGTVLSIQIKSYKSFARKKCKRERKEKKNLNYPKALEQESYHLKEQQLILFFFYHAQWKRHIISGITNMIKFLKEQRKNKL